MNREKANMDVSLIWFSIVESFLGTVTPEGHARENDPGIAIMRMDKKRCLKKRKELYLLDLKSS